MSIAPEMAPALQRLGSGNAPLHLAALWQADKLEDQQGVVLGGGRIVQ